MVQIRCIENKNDRVMKNHCGLLNFPRGKKFKEFQLHAMACSYIYQLLMDGFKKVMGYFTFLKF